MPRPVACVVCGRGIDQPTSGGRPRKYCGTACKTRAHRTRRARRDEKPLPASMRRTVNDPMIENNLGARDGDGAGSALYGNYVKWSLIEEHLTGRLTDVDVGKVFGIDDRTAARWKALRRKELKRQQAANSWTPREEHALLLEPTVESFELFYRELMQSTTVHGIDVAPFQQEWIEHLVTTVETGGRLAIQGPQRFGKTSLLVAFMVWQIVRNPNVRILFVGRTKELAEQSTGMVRNLLEDNEWLTKSFLPEGASFRPAVRSSRPWTAAEFTVDTRTLTLRSPTVTAVGAGGTILGRDADIILADDLEDFRNAQSPTQRDQLKNWYTSDLTSRKEEHTGWCYIGSAQHPEDLMAMLRRDPQWTVKVYAAHDPACQADLWVADPDDPAEPANPEEHEDCVLWPGFRSYRWLFTNRQTARDKVQWDINMLGVVADGALEIFTKEMLDDALRHQLTLGNPDPGWRLIAGLDPGGGGRAGYMAAVLWGVTDDDHRTVVDIVDIPSGGLQAIRDVMHAWYRDYRLTDWVVEMNIAAAYLYDDHTLNDLRARTGIRIIEHRTYNNKLDSGVGVGSLKDHFLAGRIHLPYGDARSRDQIDEFVRQFRRFSNRATAAAHYRMDLVMAAWFPEATIKTWGDRGQIEVDVSYAHSVYPSAYAGAY